MPKGKRNKPRPNANPSAAPSGTVNANVSNTEQNKAAIEEEDNSNLKIRLANAKERLEKVQQVIDKLGTLQVSTEKLITETCTTLDTATTQVNAAKNNGIVADITSGNENMNSEDVNNEDAENENSDGKNEKIENKGQESQQTLKRKRNRNKKKNNTLKGTDTNTSNDEEKDSVSSKENEIEKSEVIKKEAEIIENGTKKLPIDASLSDQNTMGRNKKRNKRNKNKKQIKGETENSEEGVIENSQEEVNKSEKSDCQKDTTEMIVENQNEKLSEPVNIDADENGPCQKLWKILDEGSVSENQNKEEQKVDESGHSGQTKDTLKKNKQKRNKNKKDNDLEKLESSKIAEIDLKMSTTVEGNVNQNSDQKIKLEECSTCPKEKKESVPDCEVSKPSVVSDLKATDTEVKNDDNKNENVIVENVGQLMETPKMETTNLNQESKAETIEGNKSNDSHEVKQNNNKNNEQKHKNQKNKSKKSEEIPKKENQEKIQLKNVIEEKIISDESEKKATIELNETPKNKEETKIEISDKNIEKKGEADIIAKDSVKSLEIQSVTSTQKDKPTEESSNIAKVEIKSEVKTTEIEIQKNETTELKEGVQEQKKVKENQKALETPIDAKVTEITTECKSIHLPQEEVSKSFEKEAVKMVEDTIQKKEVEEEIKLQGGLASTKPTEKKADQNQIIIPKEQKMCSKDKQDHQKSDKNVTGNSKNKQKTIEAKMSSKEKAGNVSSNLEEMKLLALTSQIKEKPKDIDGKKKNDPVEIQQKPKSVNIEENKVQPIIDVNDEAVKPVSCVLDEAKIKDQKNVSQEVKCPEATDKEQIIQNQNLNLKIEKRERISEKESKQATTAEIKESPNEEPKVENTLKVENTPNVENTPKIEKRKNKDKKNQPLDQKMPELKCSTPKSPKDLSPNKSKPNIASKPDGQKLPEISPPQKINVDQPKIVDEQNTNKKPNKTESITTDSNLQKNDEKPAEDKQKPSQPVDSKLSKPVTLEESFLILENDLKQQNLNEAASNDFVEVPLSIEDNPPLNIQKSQSEHVEVPVPKERTKSKNELKQNRKKSTSPPSVPPDIPKNKPGTTSSATEQFDSESESDPKNVQGSGFVPSVNGAKSLRHLPQLELIEMERNDKNNSPTTNKRLKDEKNLKHVDQIKELKKNDVPEKNPQGKIEAQCSQVTLIDILDAKMSLPGIKPGSVTGTVRKLPKSDECKTGAKPKLIQKQNHQNELNSSGITTNGKKIRSPPPKKAPPPIPLEPMPDDDEEFIEYKFTPREVYVCTVCQVCKKNLQEFVLCNLCQMVSYCTQEHLASDEPYHKALCGVIQEIAKKRGGHIYNNARILSDDDFRCLRVHTLNTCENMLKRQLQPFEREILLFPRICCTTICREWRPNLLVQCNDCGQTAYCSAHPEHLPDDHRKWCKVFELYTKLVIRQKNFGRIEPCLPSKIATKPYNLPATMDEVFKDLYKNYSAIKDDCIYATLTQLATAPLTAYFASQKSFQKVNDTYTIHLIGAELQFEADTLDKWETFFLHLVPTLVQLRVVFIGPELNMENLPLEILSRMRMCRICRQNCRAVKFDFQCGKLYHEYEKSAAFTKPDVVCFFNAGLYRQTGFNGKDTWPDTIQSALSQGCPVVVTSYTEIESPKDLDRLQKEVKRELTIVHSPSINPYTSQRPERNFISDEIAPMIFKNYYCFIVK